MVRGLTKARIGMCILAGVALFWLLSIILAPLFLPPGSVNFGENGKVGINDFEAERDRLNMTGYIRFLYWEGDMNHHLKASRSFFLNGNQMPEDTRDLGIYAGIITSLLVSTRRFYMMKGWGFFLGLAPMGIDGGIQLTGLYESNNPLRVFTGFIAGVTVGLAVALILVDLLASKGAERPASEVREPPAPILTLRRIFRKIDPRSGPGDAEFFTLCLVGCIAAVVNIAIYALL